MTPFRETKLSLKQLSLWSENPRFPEEYFGKPENELIDYIVSVPFYKIIDFAKEVVEDFDMPVFEKLAIFDGEGENVTVEGNRRLTVYKLLVNPFLCTDIKVQNQFEKLKRSITITEDFQIDCVISDNKKEILRYVNRKHLNNNNEAAWGTMEQVNAKFRWIDDPEKLDNFKVNLQIIIRKLNIPKEAKDKVLGRGFVTTLFRILNSRTAASHFKLVFNDDNELISANPNFIPSLIVIIRNILEQMEFNSKKFSRLNTSEIDEYLRSITIKQSAFSEDLADDKDAEVEIDKTHIPNVENIKNDDGGKEDSRSNGHVATELPNAKDFEDNGAEDQTDFSTNYGSSGATQAKKRAKINKKSTDRKYLIGKCNLVIKPTKINNIYIELKRDLLLDDSTKAVPNAVSVLFRVFIECSVDFYAEKKHGHIFKRDFTLSQKMHWTIEKLKQNGHDAKIFRNMEKVITSGQTNSVFSIQRFNDYVHDNTLEAGPSDLKKKWEIMEGFFEALWGDLN